MDPAEAKDATLANDAKDAALPTDSTESCEQMESTEFSDHSDHMPPSVAPRFHTSGVMTARGPSCQRAG